MAQTLDFSARHRVDAGSFELRAVDPGHTNGFDKEPTVDMRDELIARMDVLQSRLYGEGARSLLVVFQGLDAAGKDGTIRHVMSGLNPAGTRVASFKQPSHEELAHDFLWRCQRALPRRGEIGIFNRSHYEDVIITRVHPELLAPQHPSLPADDPKFWTQRYESINDWERHLRRNGTTMIKFMLHISRDEQRERLIARIDDERKNWKASPADFEERKHWDDYQRAFEQALNATSTKHAPWFCIPANRKWYARTAVASIIVETLEAMNPQYPTVSDETKAELQEVKRELEAEK
ncbi:MAG: polyphosphate kinase 2 family protein [Acidimicrobiia bacterium]